MISHYLSTYLFFLFHTLPHLGISFPILECHKTGGGCFCSFCFVRLTLFLLLGKISLRGVWWWVGERWLESDNRPRSAPRLSKQNK